MTARLDNHIGRISLSQAYDYSGINRSQILDDSPAEHMAYTTLHQLELVEELKSIIPRQDYFEIRFEDIIDRAQHEISRLCDWLEVEQKECQKEGWIDINRANNPSVSYSEAVVANVKGILADISRRLNYNNDKQVGN